MFVYEKRLQYPVNIKQTNPKLAKIIITQYGGPDGELAASLRYLSQRYTMPNKEAAGLCKGYGRSNRTAFRIRRLHIHQSAPPPGHIRQERQ